MMHKVTIDLPAIKTLEIELDDNLAPNTVRSLLDCLPITVSIHVWGEEIYTDPTPISVGEENSQSLVELMDVAFWPPGKAICLFFGPTPIGKKGEIRPYSPVNVIGKIRQTDKNILKEVRDGSKAVFRSSVNPFT